MPSQTAKRLKVMQQLQDEMIDLMSDFLAAENDVDRREVFKKLTILRRAMKSIRRIDRWVHAQNESPEDHTRLDVESPESAKFFDQILQ